MKAARSANGSANGGGASARLRRAGEAAFASFVRGRSDRQIDRIMGSEAALRILFGGMERSFVPEAAGGFDGAIQYVLESPLRGSTRGWALVIHGDHAHAAPGRADAPAVTLRTTVPLFMRIAAGELNPAKAIIEGDLLIEGDFQVAAKLGEMFGAESPW
jgi:putative sterol carrier protein